MFWYVYRMFFHNYTDFRIFIYYTEFFVILIGIYIPFAKILFTVPTAAASLTLFLINSEINSNSFKKFDFNFTNIKYSTIYKTKAFRLYIISYLLIFISYKVIQNRNFYLEASSEYKYIYCDLPTFLFYKILVMICVRKDVNIHFIKPFWLLYIMACSENGMQFLSGPLKA